MRLVLDTNIVMDMLFFADQRTQPLLAAVREQHLKCFTDAACLAELERVCAYPEFHLPPTGQRALLDAYRQFVTPCEAAGAETYTLPRCRDADDQKFLILAARCQADFLLTRDKMLLRLAHNRRTPPPCCIVTAEEACRLLQQAIAQ